VADQRNHCIRRITSRAAAAAERDEEDTWEESETSSSEEDEEESEATTAAVYNAKDMEHLNVSAEIKELFQYIQRYKPHDVELESQLKCFIPDYVPSVGQIDAFLKVPRPDGVSAELGLKVLNEPAAVQSDSTVLELQMQVEEQAAKEAEEQAAKEAEEHTAKEVEEQAAKEAEEQAAKEVEEQAAKEAEEQAAKEVEEQATKEAEERSWHIPPAPWERTWQET
jgi:hypothetical protein